MMKLWLSAFVVACVMIVGCEPKAETKSDEKKAPDKAKTEENKHDQWWCDEHGIPESECSMCSSKVAKECKAKGDWCDKHDRAKSQCFICDGSLMEKFAAKYEAKYGKKPPLPEDNLPGGKKPEEKKPEEKKGKE